MNNSAPAFYLVFPVSSTLEEPERLEPPIKFESVREAMLEAMDLALSCRGVIVVEVFEHEDAGHNFVHSFGDVSQELIDAFAVTARLAARRLRT
ncbi:MAG: hypothetical protein ABSE69_13395 [Roseiarcus sp.]|jgi:hypothetical protein